MSQWHHARERWSQDRGFSGRTFIGQEEGRKGHPGKDLPETIRYLRICTIGHQVPDDDTIFKFPCAVNGFLKENKDNGFLEQVNKVQEEGICAT
nr:RNA/RNP complex-1-interacting phosphatase-like isoform X2 [Kogia breviceps]